MALALTEALAKVSNELTQLLSTESLADLCRSDGYRCYAVTRRRLVELTPAQLATVRLMDRYGCQDVILAAGPLP